MALEASTLTVKVQSDGIESTTKSLEALAVAGEKAEKGTSNIGKKSGDAAQQAAAGYTALTNQLQRLASQFDGINNALSSQTQAWGALGSVQAQAATASTQVGQTTTNNASAAEAFVEKLRRQAEIIGLNTKQLREYNAEQLRNQAQQLGVTQQVDGFINKIKEAKGPHESFNLLTAGSARELMVLGHELSQGQFQRFGGSLIVLGERINFLPSLLEKAGAAASSMGVSLGVLVAGVAASVAAIAAAVITYNHSRVALKELNDQAILTGHSFGATGEAMYEMANKIGSANGRLGDTRETMIKLASTGRFTATEIGMITEAAVGLEKYGGVAIDNTIKQFERLAAEPTKANVRGFKGISQAAVELNQQLGFLEPAVLAEVIHLERIGDVAGASAVVIKALADEEKKRIVELKGELTVFGQVLDTITTKAKNMWNSLFNKGTLQDQLSEVTEHIVTLSKKIGNGGMLANNGVLQNELNGYLAKSNEIQDKIAAKDKKEADAKHKRDLDNAADLAQIEVRNILERGKFENKYQEDKARLDKAFEDMHARGITTGLGSQEAYDQALAVLKKADTLKEPKAKSDGLAGLNEHLSEINAQYEIDKRYYDNQVKFINDLQQKKLISNSAAEHAKSEFLDNESKLEEKALNDQLKMVDSFYSKDTKLMEEAESKRSEIRKRLERNQADTAIRKTMAATDPAAREQKEQDDADAKAVQVISQINAQTQAIQAKIDAYNRLPEAARAAITNEKQMQDEFTKAEIAWKEEQIDAISKMGEGSAEEVIRLTAEKKALEDRAKAQEAWEKIQAKIVANAGRSAALTKVAAEQSHMWKDIGSEIEKSLTTAFGNAGNAAGKMFKAFAEGQADAITLTDKARVVSENKSLSEEERTKQLNDIRLQGAQNQLGMYGDMADAASMFFEKGSTGYQAMAKAAQILHTAEVALSLIKGVNAILTQGEGDPYTAFARMAAMTAIVAGLGVAVSGGGGGGGFSSQDQQKIQGTGTVLGSQTITDGTKVILVGEKSNSIANSLKIAEKNSGLGLAVQNDMLNALQQLNNNISGFAAQLVKSTNIANPEINLNSNNGLAKTVTGSLLGSSLGVLGNLLLPGIGFIIGNVAGAILTKIPVIGNLIGKIGTSIFGGKQSLDDSGLSFGRTSLGSALNGGINAQSYANITTSGGWFRSDKHDTKKTSLGTDVNNQITAVIDSMYSTLQTAANALGVGGDAFNNKLKSFVVDIGNISLKGLSGDQVTQALNNVFSKLSDQMAQFAFSDLTKYQKIGEGLMETVVRVANDLMQVNDVFKVLGKTMPQAAAGIAQAEKLVDSFGSSDALTKAVKSYQDAIYTDNEKLAPVVKSVQDSLASLGLSSIKSKEDFKLVVDSLDLTSDSGVALFNKLMTLAPTFGSAIDGLAKVNDTTKSSIQSVIDKLKQFSDNIHKFRDGLVLSASSPLTPQQQLAAAASQFETTIKKAMAGDENAQGHVTDIAQSYLDAARTMFASSDSYTAIFQKVEDELAKVQDFADGGVSDAQKQLDTMTNQLTSLNTLNGTATDILNSLNNLVNGTSPASTATGSAATNAELLQTLKTLVGTVQQSDENNVNALQNNAAATYDSQTAVGKAIGEVIKAVVTTTKTGELYQTVER